MRIYLNRVPETKGFQPAAQGWHAIRQPGASLSHALAGLVGLAIPFGLCVGLSMLSYLARGDQAADTASNSAADWAAVGLVLLIFIPLHEWLHMTLHPDGGRSDRTCLVIWPGKLHFGVYYEGCMSRTRWLAMRAAPLLALTLLPACVLAAWRAMPSTFSVFLQVLMLVNGIGSGGDVVAMLLILFQLPASAHICFRGGRAYWRPQAA